MSAIILTTLNARYYHCSLGLRYLMANMGELQSETALLEFIITQKPTDIVEKLLTHQPKIIGFGVYIWNVEETTKVVLLLKQVQPEVILVLGGPEVSFEYQDQSIVQLADYLITGPADISFAKLCQRLLNGDKPSQKVMASEQAPLTQLLLPYQFYTEEDIAHRLIYVEASRGCPFKCEFCLSALDKTATPFKLEQFLGQMQTLYDRGTRHFKFVDRTFNLNLNSSLRILEFFLERLDEKLFLHFELIPDRLPNKLKAALARFPPGSLQLEIGIQTFNPDIQTLISRKQNNSKTEENLTWLRTSTNAHIHADLIVGLPGEEVASFARGFNRLVALNPHEIQVGILKRLRGAPISRHTEAYHSKYNPQPPYNLLCSDLIDFTTMQRLSRFARYWELIANSGRFRHSKPILLGDDPFERFLRFSDWLFATTQQTHRIALDRLYDLIYRGLTGALGVTEGIAQEALSRDYQESGTKDCPPFLQHDSRDRRKPSVYKKSPIPVRQARHSRS
jgi:hypothetical protein